MDSVLCFRKFHTQNNQHKHMRVNKIIIVFQKRNIFNKLFLFLLLNKPNFLNCFVVISCLNWFLPIKTYYLFYMFDRKWKWEIHCIFFNFSIKNDNKNKIFILKKIKFHIYLMCKKKKNNQKIKFQEISLPFQQNFAFWHALKGYLVRNFNPNNLIASFFLYIKIFSKFSYSFDKFLAKPPPLPHGNLI